jgi:hypothetical protein
MGVFLVVSDFLALLQRSVLGTPQGMDPASAIAQLRSECNQLASGITRMHPCIAKLGNANAQGEIFKAVFELTKQVEVIKKHLIRLEKGEDTPLT